EEQGGGPAHEAEGHLLDGGDGELLGGAGAREELQHTEAEEHQAQADPQQLHAVTGQDPGAGVHRLVDGGRGGGGRGGRPLGQGGNAHGRASSRFSFGPTGGGSNGRN